MAGRGDDGEQSIDQSQLCIYFIIFQLTNQRSAFCKNQPITSSGSVQVESRSSDSVQEEAGEARDEDDGEADSAGEGQH